MKTIPDLSFDFFVMHLRCKLATDFPAGDSLVVISDKSSLVARYLISLQAVNMNSF